MRRRWGQDQKPEVRRLAAEAVLSQTEERKSSKDPGLGSNLFDLFPSRVRDADG